MNTAISRALSALERIASRHPSLTMDECASILVQKQPRLVADAQEDLGYWPASDLACRAIQRARTM